MIPNPMLILAVVVAFALNGFYWHAKGSNSADERWTAKITAERLAATEKARATEKSWQGAVNALTKHHQAQTAGVRRNLDLALNSLRNRPERPATLPQTARVGCEGANGPELAGEHARFLARYAALAAEQDAGLQACYTYADSLK